ncbi:hypothetical protein JHK84_043505 [Glycine max]|nr:hypothetical protein JHK86_043319 [Glycine max]KAG5117392.1 hypothetical protein JHK84_043505 [Glycine max]
MCELDLYSIPQSGRKAFCITAVEISLPFICGIDVAVILCKIVDGVDKAGFPQFLIFMGVSLSITAFPVLARILVKLKLFTIPHGRRQRTQKPPRVCLGSPRVTIGNGPSLGWVFMADFLTALTIKVMTSTTTVDNYQRIYVPLGIPLRPKIECVEQELLSGDTVVIAETGDSWFNCQKLHLPENCGYEFQMQYGSIGWSVGATLGYA